MDYTDTIIEVMDQYNLTESKRESVMAKVMDGLCPWFRKIVYSRAHHFAAEAERST